jgi:hypothetical protein
MKKKLFKILRYILTTIKSRVISYREFAVYRELLCDILIFIWMIDMLRSFICSINFFYDRYKNL